MAIFEYGNYSNTFDAPDSMVEIFENSVAKFADNPLIGEKNEAGVYQWTTYSQIATRVDNLRAGLASIGVKQGDKIGIIANNRKEWLIGEIAAQGLGAAYVPMYEKELISMWKYIVKDAGIKVLLVSKPEVMAKIKDFPSEIPTLEKIFLIEGSGENSLEALEKKGRPNRFPRFVRNQPSLLY